jgi:hypothetical protein
MYKNQKIKFISADSHFCEPEKFYTNRLPKSLHEEAPRYIEIKKNLFWTDSFSLVPISASIGAGTADKNLSFRCSRNKFLEFCDLNKRVKMQNKDGAIHEVLLPNLGLLWRIKNKKIKKLCFEIYNDYAIDFEKKLLSKRFSILPIIYGSTAEEMKNSLENILKKTLKNNLHGVVVDINQIWILQKNQKSKARDFIFSEIQKVDIPIILHANGSILNNAFTRPYTAKHSLFCVNAMSILVELYTSGFFDKFRKVKFIFSEMGLSWINQIHYKLTYYKERFRYLDNLTHLNRNFDDVLKKNIFCTFTTELPDIQTLKLVGMKNIMFGSDFPHNESFFPNTNIFLKRIVNKYENHENFIINNTIDNYKLNSKIQF